MQIYTSNNLNPQRWKVISLDTPNNIYKFEPQSQAGKRLDAANGVTITTAVNTASQNWKLYPVDAANGIFELEPQSSLGSRLDVFQTTGPDVLVYTDNNQPNQRWKFVKLSSAARKSAEQKAAELQLTVYPNPAQSEVTLESPEEIRSVKLVNGLGRTSLSRENLKSRRITLATNGLANGMYVVQTVTVQGRRLNQKLLIAR